VAEKLAKCLQVPTYLPVSSVSTLAVFLFLLSRTDWLTN
jgi:hypothetical protein